MLAPSAILLLDSPLKRVVSRAFAGVKSVDSEPYQGGYKDFIKYANLVDACSTPGPSRASIIEDISYYWCTYGHRVEVGADPLITTLFMQKIIASHYMHYIGYFSSLVAYLDWALSWQVDLVTINSTWIEQRWSDLKAWNTQFIEAVNMNEGFIALLKRSQPSSTELIDCLRDFHDIHKRLIQLKARCDSSLSSFTDLAGIVHNRHSLLEAKSSLEEAKRSFHEAKSLKTLSWLATIFIPLTFASGILSMNDLYVPGPGQFWIYPVIAVPFVILVAVIIVVVNNGYNPAGNWSWTTLRISLSGMAEQSTGPGVPLPKEEPRLPEMGRAV